MQNKKIKNYRLNILILNNNKTIIINYYQYCNNMGEINNNCPYSNNSYYLYIFLFTLKV